mgnify:FL=1
MNDSIEIYEDTYPLTEEEYACLFEVPDDVEVE